MNASATRYSWAIPNLGKSKHKTCNKKCAGITTTQIEPPINNLIILDFK
jgi:hypothetical protein